MDALFERYKASYMSVRPGNNTGLEQHSNLINKGRPVYNQNAASHNAVNNTYSGPLQVKAELQSRTLNQRTVNNLAQASTE